MVIDMNLEFDVTMNASTLYDYMLHHTYMSFSGLLGTGVGAVMIVASVMSGSFYLLAAGLIILLYIPCTLFLKSKKQMLSNPAFKQPLHYTLSDEGVSVSQDGAQQTISWEDVWKATASNRSIFLYTSSNNAWILPKKDLEQDRFQVIEMISTHMPPKKIRIRQ